MKSCVPALILLIALASARFTQAVPLEPDDFNEGLSPAWEEPFPFGNLVFPNVEAVNGRLQLTGAGEGFSAELDSAVMLPQTVTGNFRMQARVLAVPQCNATSSGGLIVRQDASENRPSFAYLGLTRNQGVELIGGGNRFVETERLNEPSLRAPYWLRMVTVQVSQFERIVGGYLAESPEGPWRSAGSITLGMTDPFLAGFAIVPRCQEETGRALFDDFQVTLIEGGTLTLRATLVNRFDPRGNPLPATNITAVARQGGQVVAEDQGDDSGRILLTGLPGGDIEVEVAGRTVETLRFDLTLEPDGAVNMPIHLTPLPSLLDLSSVRGQVWELQLPAEDETLTSLEVAELPSEAFEIASMPGTWDLSGAGESVYGWYRTTVNLDESSVGEPLALAGWQFGDEDWTYWNGTLIGHTEGRERTREYLIDRSLAKEENQLVILGRNGSSDGGFTGEAPQLYLIDGSTPGVTPGDLNGDHQVSILDATLALRFAVKLAEPTEAQRIAGDINGDDQINLLDATIILRIAVGLQTLP